MIQHLLPEVFLLGWMDRPKAIKKHQGCNCHREAMEALVLPRFVKDVGELLSAEHAVVSVLLQNLRFISNKAYP